MTMAKVTFTRHDASVKRFAFWHDASVAASNRKYGGVSAAERAVHRRAALLEAALDVVGADGWPSVAVKPVCQRAGVTERYFYSEFGSLGALKMALVELVAADTRRVIENALTSAAPDPASTLATLVGEVWHLLLDDPRRGRVAAMQGVAEVDLLTRRAQIESEFESLLVLHGKAAFGTDLDDVDLAIASAALVGAADEVFRRLLAGDLDVDAHRASAQLVSMFTR